MLNCLEASRLLSERLERKLSLRERLALRFHLILCRLCRAFGKKVEQLHSFLREYGAESSDDAKTPGLSKQSRRRIQETLKKEIG